ncbi:hypothetical protein DPMN_020008 [Dreissena polymorpha]|uniref:CCHC-type domain-containing protein n=1 Tax=Dreissena polymorpha TaxID=45954 RepID=A0A9D4NKB3_DREPO|nr:hypothetical protein DPMN_020008 [Dreissena polymorpha]
MMENLESLIFVIVIVSSFGLAIIAGQIGLWSAAAGLREHYNSGGHHNRNDHRKYKRNNISNVECFNCHNLGHYKSECPILTAEKDKEC